ncbi:MAG: ATP phosphoribosyltransferase regulatory subunit [bacterium]
MMDHQNWLLPEGIEELLPEKADQLEQLRRSLIDLFASWGYELVVTPIVEYLDALLTGTGKDLELQTFTLTDQISGRQLGIRADITPQAARIDAHLIRREAPTRLCYLGSVLRSRPDSFGGSRSPMQVGAELYGHAGVESDCEVICLMAEMLDKAGLRDVSLDLGHVGVFRGLSQQANLNAEQEAQLFDALQRKAIPEIADLVAGLELEPSLADMMVALPTLNGDRDVLETAREKLQAANPDVLQAIDYVDTLANRLADFAPQLNVHFDLAELRAYQYQTGVVFAAFVPGSGQEIARGGRYDDIGETFGRSRPATGFSADIKRLMKHGAIESPGKSRIILAPDEASADLMLAVSELRNSGDSVIHALTGQSGSASEMGCTHELVLEQDQWIVKSL